MSWPGAASARHSRSPQTCVVPGAQRSRRRRSDRPSGRRSRAAAPSCPSARSAAPRLPATRSGSRRRAAIAALPPMWSEWQCVLTSLAQRLVAAARARERAARASAARAARSRSRSARGRRGLLSRMLFADSQSRTKTCSCGGKQHARVIASLPRKSRTSATRSASVGAARSMRMRSGPAKRMRPSFCTSRISLPGSNGGCLTNWSVVRSGPASILAHAERLGGEAQPMAREQRLRRLRRRAEAVDQLLLDRVEFRRRVRAREPLVQDEPLVHVVAVERRQQRRHVQVDLGRHAERLRRGRARARTSARDTAAFSMSA